MPQNLHPLHKSTKIPGCKHTHTYTHMKWVWIWRPVVIENPGNTFHSCLLPQRESFVLTERQRGYRVSPFRVSRIILALKTMTSSWLSPCIFVCVCVQWRDERCMCVWFGLHLWQYWNRRESKRQEEKQEEFGQGWITRGRERGGVIVRREVFLSPVWSASSSNPLSVCPWWNDLYMTLVRGGGNAKHTHMQLGTGSGGLRQEIPLQPFCWLRPQSGNRVRKNVMYMVSVLFGVQLGQHMHKTLSLGAEGVSFGIWEQNYDYYWTNKQVNMGTSLRWFCPWDPTLKTVSYYRLKHISWAGVFMIPDVYLDLICLIFLEYIRQHIHRRLRFKVLFPHP